MRTIFTWVACLLVVCLQAQTDPEAKPYKVENDTMYAMVDQQGKILNLPGMPYVRKWWPEANRFKEILYDAAGGTLKRIAWYSDAACTQKEGICEVYHPNGMLEDSGLYVHNNKEGMFTGWYEDGMLHHKLFFKAGQLIDTGLVFSKAGILQRLTIATTPGNGIEQHYYGSGKVKLLGRFEAGMRQGVWIVKREDGTKMMELQYAKDSLFQTSCFAEDGITPVHGMCIYEKLPEFPGGVKGWSAFLQKNLRYPKTAIEKDIQGVVRVKFVVDKDGTASAFEILSAPDASLGNEVLRLMKQSPKWEPGIQLNQPVKYSHIQAVTFKLE